MRNRLNRGVFILLQSAIRLPIVLALSLLLGGVLVKAQVASITFVQVNSAVPRQARTSVSVTYTKAQTAGDLNVIVVGWSDSTAQVNSVTDSKGNVYTLAVGPTVQAGVATQAIYYASNIAAAAPSGNIMTVTFGTAAAYPDIRIAEYSGIATAAPVDVVAAAQGSGTSSSSGPVTTKNANDLLVGANLVQQRTTGPGSGYTSRVITKPDSDILEDRVVSATGSYSATAQVSSGSWIMQMVAFRAGTTLPTVSSVTPNGGTTAGGTAVTITGTNFAAGATVTFGGRAASNVVVVNSTTITATTPAGSAGAVMVTVTVNGHSGSLTSGFSYIAPPIVSSVTPNGGSTAGGTAVTISGTNFAAGATVRFGAAAATSVVVANSTTITANTPAGSAGAVTITVTVSGQSGSLANGFTYIATVMVATPTFKPGAGTYGSAQSVSITSTTSGATICYTTNGSTPAANTPGTCSTGTALADGGSVMVSTSETLKAIGTENGFTNSAVGSASYTIGTCMQNLATGNFTLCGESYNDVSTGANVRVNYSPSPSNGIIAWATWCFNSECNSSISGVTATIGDNINATESCFVASPHSPFITNANGAGQGSGDFQQHYVWYCPGIPSGVTSFTVTPSNPSLSYLQLNITEWKAGSLAASCSPISACFENVDNFGQAGNSTGGTTATITTSGSTVNANDLIFAVTEVPCCSFTASPGTGYTGITVAPSVTPGMVSEAKAAPATGIQTATTTWTGGSTPWFGVIVPLKGAGAAPVVPTVGTVSPNNGSTAGGTAVTITGTNFVAGATVSFGGAAASNVVVVNSTTITATTPAGSAGAVTVNGQRGSLTNGFSYIAPPIVSSVTPNGGSTAGGTAVTITGTNFVAGATVTFGGAVATNVVVVSSTSITARTPAGSAGAVTVTVGGQSGRLTNGFSYAPTLAVPTLVQHVASGMDNQFVTTLTISLPNPAGAGNALVLGLRFNGAGSIALVGDNEGNNWVVGPTVMNSTSGAPVSTRMSTYYALNVLHATQTITIAFSGLGGPNGNAGFPQAVLSEFYNVAAVSAFDGSSVNSSSTTVGTITTTADGDLIYEWGGDVSAMDINYGAMFNGNSINSGPGFTLLSSDLQTGSADQYMVQSAAGAINPTFSASGSDTWSSVSLALKSAQAGTPPPQYGIRIVHIQHEMVAWRSHSSPVTLAFPSSGNLLVAMFTAKTSFVSTINDSNGNNWVSAASIPGDTNISPTAAQILYAANAKTGPDLSSISTALTQACAADCNLVLYDIAGATTSPYDTSSAAFGDQQSAGPVTMASFSPANPDELILMVGAIDFHTINSVEGAGYVLDSVVNAFDNHDAPPGTGPSRLDMDNAFAHINNPTASPLTFVFTATTSTPGGIRSWGCVASAFIGIQTPPGP